MITIRFSGRTPSPEQTRIGMETDSGAESLRFLLPQIADGQSAQLMMLLPDETAEILQIRDGVAVIPARVTEISGRCRCWVEILGGDQVAWNSELLYLDIGALPAMGERTQAQYPTAIQDALDACVQAERYRDETRAAAGMMITQGGMLHFDIGTDGHLYMYYSRSIPVRFELTEGELYVYGH